MRVLTTSAGWVMMEAKTPATTPHGKEGTLSGPRTVSRKKVNQQVHAHKNSFVVVHHCVFNVILTSISKQHVIMSSANTAIRYNHRLLAQARAECTAAYKIMKMERWLLPCTVTLIAPSLTQDIIHI